MSLEGFGPRVKLRSLALLGALAVAGSGVGIAACGDDTDDGGGAALEGGEITIAQTSQPDALDPALSYTVNGWEPMWVVYTPLLTYRHEEGNAGAELIPGLAEDLPEVSEDGTTYTFQLRDGLTYSDGTEVKASDVEHTIKRVFTLESGGLSFYQGIVGAEEYLKAGDPEADVEGITTDDSTGEIVIELVEPDATFSNVMAMNFAGLVPGDTPFKNLTESPPPGVGPYEITESVPNRQFVMEKVDGFADLEIPEIPAGHVDKITTQIVKNQTQQAQDVLDNELDFMQDPPPADFKPTVLQQVGPEGSEEQRYAEYPTLSTYYFFMNHREPPFDDPEVREAVNIGLDKPAIARLFGGELTPGCSFLSPGVPGYDEALDVSECPFGDPNQAGDMETARQMIEDAGAAGEQVTVWGNNDDPTDKVTEAYAEQLSEMGFEIEVEIVDGGIWVQTLGNEDTRAQTGFANWFADFPHPLNFYFLVDGASIQPRNNNNWGYVDDPRINEELESLRLEPDVAEVEQDWADLDRYVVESAVMAPFGHRSLATFVSDRIDFESTIFHPLYQNDYTSFQLTEEAE